MKPLKTLAVLALSATLLSGCVSNKDAIITINDQPITQAEYQKAFDAVTKNSMVAQLGIDLKKEENSFIALTLKDRVVNELIVKNLLEQDIQKKNIKVSSKDVEKELQTIIDQIGGKDKFNEILKQNGISANQFKHDLEEEVKIKKLVEELKVVNITDKDAEKFYKSNIAKFKHSERVKASHILVAANPESIKSEITSDPKNASLSASEVEARVATELKAKEEKAKKLLAEVQKDPSKFEKIARENSDDMISAQKGGDLGYFGKEQMVPEFLKAAFSQKPSTVSDLVKTQFGYHIILVTDRQEAGTESFDKVKNDIKSYLENQERVNVLQQHVDKLKNEANIVFNDQSYNPEEIQKQIREKAAENSAATPENKASDKK